MKREIKVWHLVVGWMITNLLFFLIHPVLGIMNNTVWMFLLIIKGESLNK